MVCFICLIVWNCMSFLFFLNFLLFWIFWFSDSCDVSVLSEFSDLSGITKISIFFHVALRDIWITADSGVAEQESRKLPASSSLAPLAPVLESRGPALFWMGSVRAYWLWWISSPNWGSSSYPISGLHPHLPTTVAIVGWSSMLAPSSHTNFVGVLTLKTPTCGYVMVCPNYHFFDLPPISLRRFAQRRNFCRWTSWKRRQALSPCAGDDRATRREGIEIMMGFNGIYI